VLGLDLSAAIDPTATFAVHCGNGFDAGFGPAKVVPDAVLRGPEGFLRVNYTRLGLELQTWDEWVASTQGRITHQLPATVVNVTR
jgi:hypothetical protein